MIENELPSADTVSMNPFVVPVMKHDTAFCFAFTAFNRISFLTTDFVWSTASIVDAIIDKT